jgi:sugar-specific transcriptional regulator TrmB
MTVLNGSGKRVIESLAKMGMTEYVGRAYFTLLLCGELKAWDISKLSGVPSSKVYWAMETLLEAGLAEVTDGKPKTYRASNLARASKIYTEARMQEAKRAREASRYLGTVSKAYSALARENVRKRRFRIFEPRYGRGLRPSPPSLS